MHECRINYNLLEWKSCGKKSTPSAVYTKAFCPKQAYHRVGKLEKMASALSLKHSIKHICQLPLSEDETHCMKFGIKWNNGHKSQAAEWQEIFMAKQLCSNYAHINIGEDIIFFTALTSCPLQKDQIEKVIKCAVVTLSSRWMCFKLQKRIKERSRQVWPHTTQFLSLSGKGCKRRGNCLDKFFLSEQFILRSLCDMLVFFLDVESNERK